MPSPCRNDFAVVGDLRQEAMAQRFIGDGVRLGHQRPMGLAQPNGSRREV